LTEGQHHFEKRENIISNLFGTNERCCAVGANDVLRNDVALRAKGKLHFPNTKVLDFQGLFVFLGGKNTTLLTLRLCPDLLDLNLRLAIEKCIEIFMVM